MKPLAVLRKYFGLLPGQSLADSPPKLKALTEEEKLELATLAAAELGVELAA